MPGPPKKPTRLKVIQGTDRADRRVENEPEFGILEKAPKPPDYLEGLALLKWQEVAKQLVDAKVLQAPDLDGLAGYCIAYQNMVEAQEQLRREGNTVLGGMGGPIKNPAFTVLDGSMAKMLAFGNTMGLNPAARARVNVAQANKKDGKPSFGSLRKDARRKERN